MSADSVIDNKKAHEIDMANNSCVNLIRSAEMAKISYLYGTD